MKIPALIITVSVLIVLFHYQEASCAKTFQRDDRLYDGRPLILMNSSSVVLDSPSNVILPGVNICTRSNLSHPLKSNSIYIGVIGTHIDPLLAHINDEDIMITYNGTNCAENSTRHCPIPEYIISLLEILNEVNSAEDVLPYHKLCLRAAIMDPVPNVSALTSAVYDQCIDQDDISIIVNIAWGEIATFIHEVLLPYGIPVVSFSQPGNYHTLSVNSIIDMFQEKQSESVTDIEQDYLFTMAPNNSLVFRVLDAIAMHYNWRTIGLVVEDRGFFESDTFIQFKNSARGIKFIAVHYLEGKLLERFQPFIEKEIQIFIFHGRARVYLRLLHEAYQFDFVGTQITWIYSYHNIIFPENYPDLWCGFTDEEIVTIKKALRGSLLIGLDRGSGSVYKEFIGDYAKIAEEVSGLASQMCTRPQFIHTAYMHDSIKIIAQAMDDLVRYKAKEYNQSIEEVQIGRMSHSLLTRFLLQTYVDDHAATGPISFTSERKRAISLFVIRNFVPTVDIDDPFVLQTKGMVQNNEDDFHFIFFTDDGATTNRSTVIFSDGTSNIPLDRPYHIYVRQPYIGVATIVIFSSVFVVVLICYLVSTYYEDVRAVQLVNISIYSDNDLRFASEKNDLQKKVARNTIGSGSTKDRTDVAQLRKRSGTFVQLSHAKFTRSLFTKTVFLEIDKLRTLSHPNVALFHGCLLCESKAAFLHEYCSRGTLQDVLDNSELELDWVFKLSFALDAAEGMMYLHSRRIVHGRLSTTTCTVNEQWTLKIKDYGLKQLHKPMDTISVSVDAPFTMKRNIKRDRSIPPEVRLFGESLNYTTDIYSYGLVLEELAKKSWTTLEGVFGKSLLGKSRREGSESVDIDEDGVHQNSLKNDYYEEVITPKVKKIIQSCLDSMPQARPAFDWISYKIRQTSYFFQKEGQAKLSMLQIYSRRLEERLEDMGDLMVTERDHSNNVIRSFIPECMIVSEEKGQLMALKQYNKAILSVEITNAEYLMNCVDIADFNRIVVLLQKTVEGVINNYDMNRLQTRGTTWIIMSVGDANPGSIHAAICAAQSIFDNLKDIPVPGFPGTHPVARAGLHAGNIVCGVVEQPIPKVVCFGSTIAIAIQLMLCSKDARTLACTNLTQQMSDEYEHLQIKSHIAMEIDNKLITTMWVQMPMSCPRKELTTQESGFGSLKNSSIYGSMRVDHRTKYSRPFSESSHRGHRLASSPSRYRSTVSRGALFSDHNGTQYSELDNLFSPKF